MHVDELTENYTPSEIADILNEKVTVHGMAIYLT